MMEPAAAARLTKSSAAASSAKGSTGSSRSAIRCSGAREVASTTTSPPSKLGDDRCDSLQMLEVVEHEQHPPRGEPAGDVVVGSQPDRFGDGGPHRPRLTQGGKPGEERPVQEIVRELRRRLQRQPRLPRPAGPGERQQSHPAGHETADLCQLPLAAEQRPRRDRQVRPSQRPERRELPASKLVDTLSRQEILEPVLTEVAQLTVDERCRLLRHQYLPAMAGRRDTGSTMNVDAYVALLREERRPRVQTDADTYRARHQCLGQLGGGSESGGRCCEREEERVALRIDLDSMVTGACLTNDLPVCGKCPGIGLRSQLVQELRRPLDVGEEEGDSAGRKHLRHAP